MVRQGCIAWDADDSKPQMTPLPHEREKERERWARKFRSFRNGLHKVYPATVSSSGEMLAPSARPFIPWITLAVADGHQPGSSGGSSRVAVAAGQHEICASEHLTQYISTHL